VVASSIFASFFLAADSSLTVIFPINFDYLLNYSGFPDKTYHRPNYPPFPNRPNKKTIY